MSRDLEIERQIREMVEKQRVLSEDKRIYSEGSGNEVGLEITGPVSVVVIPNEKDYEKGHIKRFFVARYDSSEAMEISEEFANKEGKKLPKGIYTLVKINWYLNDKALPKLKKITATLNARNVNEYLTMRKAKEMPQLMNTIKDFDQFIR